MKYAHTDSMRNEMKESMRKIGKVLGITLAGEWLNFVLPLPVPAGVYGLFLMLLLFCTGLLKLEQVEGAGNFLLDIMPVLFVPAAVGLMESYGQLKEVLVPVFIICLLSTVVVMAVTGKVAEGMMKLHEKKEEDK